jgi:mono/diheme cytochrome c family protein
VKIRFVHIAAVLLGIAAFEASAAQSGEQIFKGECAACHQADASGAVGLAPPLHDTLKGFFATPQGRGYLAQIVISGMAGPIKSQAQFWNGVMPNFTQHSDAELALTLNYVLTNFNAVEQKNPQLITAAQVAEARKRAPSAGETRQLRQQLLTAGH